MDQGRPIAAEPVRLPVPATAGELKPLAVAVSLALGFSAGAVGTANAATITVNNLGGGSVAGQCTFSDAVQAANTNLAVQGCAAGSGTDNIVFSVAGTITLASTVTISESVTIAGGGSITLSPTGTNRILYLDDTPPANVTLSGLTFAGNGTSTHDGAAIFHYDGALTIQYCVFTGNSTTGRGGAIFNYFGSLTIQDSTFSGNHANTGNGGAIYMYAGGPLTISNSTLTGNTAQSGGAIYLYNAAASSITNSTLSGNSATGKGGAIVMYGTDLAISNSTLSGNSAGTDGGAIYLTGSTLTLVSTIVANSTDLGGAPKGDIWDETGATVNSTNSLIGNTAGFNFNVDVNNIKNQNPLLGPLANNGGTTRTHALLAGSPAIDKGSNPLALAFDQRGAGFPRTTGAQTDIGAFEGVGVAPPPQVATVIPTMSQWGLALLSVLMAGWAMFTGFGRRRRS